MPALAPVIRTVPGTVVIGSWSAGGGRASPQDSGEAGARPSADGNEGPGAAGRTPVTVSSPEEKEIEMRILRAVPFLVALAALLGAEARPARAADPPTIGVGSHQLDARSVAALRDLGIRQVRTTLYMPLWENDPAWRREFDAGVERARRAGLELLVVVHEPSGARM